MSCFSALAMSDAHTSDEDIELNLTKGCFTSIIVTVREERSYWAYQWASCKNHWEVDIVARGGVEGCVPTKICNSCNTN